MESRMMSARPMSSALNLSSRPITSSGLVAPKTSRGRSALRRQVQDKSYWMGVLRSKMNDLRNEINRLGKECEAMRREESQISAWQRKAESLAKELNNLTQELSVYNEYTDRIRSGESIDEIKEDIAYLIEENDELHSRLEIAFEEKKRKEVLVANYEGEIKRIENNWNSLRRLMSAAERERFEEMERENKEMSFECERLERQIVEWKDKKSKLEMINESSVDFFLRKETLQALMKLRALEKQKNDLMSESNAEDERGRLLAQVKRDNQEIASMESRMESLRNDVASLKADIEACDDVDAVEKYRELKKKEQSFDDFLKDFEQNKINETRKLQSYGESINSLVSRTSKFLSFIDTLKSAGEKSGSDKDAKSSLLDEKRKLELELSKLQQLETKVVVELESLKKKVKTFDADIETYSDIPKLKAEMEAKVKDLEQKKQDYAEEISDAEERNKELSEKVKSTRKMLEEDDLYKKIRDLELKLSKILTSKVQLKEEIDANDNTFIKSQVMDNIKKYNEKLLGF
ncbi:Spc7-like protein [Leptotrombidium deliense]|uniref:Spc7-like protein n=1 Tax=Leptotrombidium deliense TaxID=299467 RepID=A0A443SU91_9ACAR|nr:Spc7-like protein [Leptotrombidium deliense]